MAHSHQKWEGSKGNKQAWEPNHWSEKKGDGGENCWNLRCHVSKIIIGYRVSNRPRLSHQTTLKLVSNNSKFELAVSVSSGVGLSQHACSWSVTSCITSGKKESISFFSTAKKSWLKVKLQFFSSSYVICPWTIYGFNRHLHVFRMQVDVGIFQSKLG